MGSLAERSHQRRVGGLVLQPPPEVAEQADFDFEAA